MTQSPENIKVALADDHILLRSALAALIDGFGDCTVVAQCSNGLELIKEVEKGTTPDVIILDLNMPELDGFATAAWLTANRPAIYILMLTMFDSELSLIRLLKNGARGFLKKDIHPNELRRAINTVVQTGFYYSSHTTGKIINLFRSNNQANPLQNSLLTDQEIEFLRLACTDLTYKEIAQRMGLNPRSIDTLRDHLFVKFDVKSRVGLAMISLRQGVVAFL